jgi:nitrogen fixation/metabolism regulation signal transduction histidine kinase
LFLTAGLVATFFAFRPMDPDSISRRIAAVLNAELLAINREAKAILKNSSESAIDLPPANEHSFFVYNFDQLVKWSDNSFVPPIQAVKDTFKVRLLKTSGGDYLVRKWKIDADGFLLGVIPLHREFKIQNDYLNPQWNKRIFPQGNVAILEPAADSGIPIFINGSCVFKVIFLAGDFPFHEHTRWVAFVLLALAIVFFIILCYSLLPYVKNKSAILGFMFLLICFALLRIIMAEFNFPNLLVSTALFDPKNFASSSYNASFGDLLLNEVMIAALCYYLFKNQRLLRISRLKFSHYGVNALLSVISSVCVLFAMLYPFVVIQTLFNNSAVSLDISESIHFDQLRCFAFLSILISWVCAFLFIHVFVRLAIFKKHAYYSVTFAVTGAIIFILINAYSEQVYLSSLILGCVYFILIYFLKLYSSFRKLSYATFVYLFLALFCMALNGAYGIYSFTQRDKIASQFRFANNFLIDRDNFGEYLLHEAAIKIASDEFVRLRLSSPFLSRDIIRQKIRQVFLPSYFNKYDVEILLFNSAGIPFGNRNFTTFSELVNQYDKEAYRTDYEDIYFANSPSSDVTQKYLVIVPVSRFKVTIGYIVVELSLKKIIPENVYPELLVDNSFQQFYKTQDLSYAVFSNKDIVFSSGDFNYEGFFNREWLGRIELYNTGVTASGYIHIAQEDEVGRAAVVSSRIVSPFFIISNFSFLLVLGLLAILLLLLGQGLLSYLKGHKLFFSARIQLFLNMAFFLPLIVVSITTLSLTSRSSQEQLNEEYLNKSRMFETQISGFLDDYLKYTDENQVNFENRLTDLTQLTNLDANVFNPKGILTATSQPLIFENGLLSAYVNPKALKRVSKGEHLFIEQERVGSLSYFVSYVALKSPQTGKLLGILAIPFFQSIYSLEKIQTVIFTNILNIFAAIFIVLLLLSYLVSAWLTFPLKFITQSLSKTSLTKTNQPLTWKADDEIGLMVKEYNQMLFKLSESKAELEQTQRERAWREIAQQVAHEIKNPLTPMKLMLQQLERGIDSGAITPEKMQKSLSSLLTQVDTLNDIASSFSSFAKMPDLVIQKIEVVSLLKRVVDLHSQSGFIAFKATEKQLFVKGDEQLLGRTFSNIIINALQAERPGTRIKVEILIEVTKTKRCLLTFTDNGKGIDAVHIERVFVPHFSTKKSGSGLGLAIAKQGIEQMGGKIWFDTDAGKGTSFYIELLLD